MSIQLPTNHSRHPNAVFIQVLGLIGLTFETAITSLDIWNDKGLTILYVHWPLKLVAILSDVSYGVNQ